MIQNSEYIDLLSNSPLTKRQLAVYRYGTKGARPKIYLQASLHADETPGMLVLYHLNHLLKKAEQENNIIGEIVLVPVANPIGLGQILNGNLVGRYELSGKGNFNRAWPDLYLETVPCLEGKLTQNPEKNVNIIRQTIDEILKKQKITNELNALKLSLLKLAFDADFVFDLHCDDDALMHLFLIPDHWPAAQDLACDIHSQAVLLCADSGGHSFDEALSTLWSKLAQTFPNYPIPAACMAGTIEYRGQTDVDDNLAHQDAIRLFNFMQRRFIIKGIPPPLPKPLCEATDLAACDVLRSPIAGIVCYKHSLGSIIHQGDLVAEIIQPHLLDLQIREPIYSNTTGLLLSKRQHKMVRPGDTIAKIVGKETLSYRHGLLLED
ncbi:MAG: succinylglutamate desuccinylase/aspartoacylase family protein [Alphaproteobacteria bacterium]|nr:succinylglutamate desuccinylase/aspartoacylase family protein [Alphaproteobacteria bacterium]